MKCRHCQAPLNLLFVDLGNAPPSNAYLTGADLAVREKTYPLRVLVCETCWLVQTEDFVRADELFASNYAYFSSFSTTWVEHAKHYVGKMVDRFNLGPGSFVVEVAANDGYLLQFVQERKIPCLGVEPTASTAAAARKKGIEIVDKFFGERLGTELASSGRSADLTAANNVLAHVPDINDFVRGFTTLLKPTGVSTFEFPHLLNLVRQNQFDTIYHEHYSYLSLTAVERVFRAGGLRVFDVDEIPTHGGSLRVYACRANGAHNVRADSTQKVSDNVAAMLQRERSAGVATREFYTGFQPRVEKVKQDLLNFLRTVKKSGKKVVGYGAAAKGNTLFNFAGVTSDLVAFVVDRSTAKQGHFLPGSHIEIVGEERLRATKPDYILILPWNLRDEIMNQLEYARAWGAKFVTAIPELEVS